MLQVITPGQNAVDTPCDESGINGYRPSPMINSMPLGEILVALIIYRLADETGYLHPEDSLVRLNF